MAIGLRSSIGRSDPLHPSGPERLGSRARAGAEKYTRFSRPGRLKIGIAPREKDPQSCVAAYPVSDLVY